MKEIYDALVKIVGPEWVSNHAEERFIYSRDPGTMEPREPDLVVMPNSSEEVQKIMVLATEKGIPVVPMGGGLVLSGLTRPLKGGIVLDMKRMNRILEVNETSRSVLVEAGASQGMLQAYLKKAPSGAQAFDSRRAAHRHDRRQRADPRLRPPLRGGRLSLRHAERNGGGPAHGRDREDRLLRHVALLVLPGAASGPGGALHRMERNHGGGHEAGHQALPRPAPQ